MTLIGGGSVSTISRPTKVTEPFTRAKPILAPLSRNTVLTAPTSAKEVRQFGFDNSEYEVSYAAGDSLGVYASATPVAGQEGRAPGRAASVAVEADGSSRACATRRPQLRICRVRPTSAVRRGIRGDSAAAKALRSTS